MGGHEPPRARPRPAQTREGVHCADRKPCTDRRCGHRLEPLPPRTNQFPIGPWGGGPKARGWGGSRGGRGGWMGGPVAWPGAVVAGAVVGWAGFSRMEARPGHFHQRLEALPCLGPEPIAPAMALIEPATETSMTTSAHFHGRKRGSSAGSPLCVDGSDDRDVILHDLQVYSHGAIAAEVV